MSNLASCVFGMALIIGFDVVGDSDSKLAEQCPLSFVPVKAGIISILDEALVLCLALDVVLPPCGELRRLAPVSAYVVLIYSGSSR